MITKEVAVDDKRRKDVVYGDWILLHTVTKHVQKSSIVANAKKKNLPA